MRTLLALTAMFGSVLAFSTSEAKTITVPIPAQENWVAAKHHVHLPNGVDMAYVEMGNPDGPPLLLIHGYTDSSRSWSMLAPYLKGRHLVAIDLRGHGSSSAPPCCYTLQDLADDVSLFITAKHLGPVDVAGHSLGSLTGQMLAASHPEQVRKLVLIDSTTETGIRPGSWFWDGVMGLKAPIEPNSAFIQQFYAAPAAVDQHFVNAARREAAHVPLYVWHGVLWSLLTTDLGPMQPFIKAPLLIIWGDQDPIFTQSHQDKLITAHPDAKFVRMRGYGHDPNWEAPDKVGELISEFLSQ